MKPVLSESVESPESQALYRAFVQKKLSTPTLCDGRPDLYVDWTEPPPDWEAELLCHLCPLLVDCREVADSMLNPEGVWGGRVYVDQEKGAEDG